MTPEELERRFPLGRLPKPRGFPESEHDGHSYVVGNYVRAHTLGQVASELRKLHMDSGWTNIRGAAQVALVKLIAELDEVRE